MKKRIIPFIQPISVLIITLTILMLGCPPPPKPYELFGDVVQTDSDGEYASFTESSGYGALADSAIAEDSTGAKENTSAVVEPDVFRINGTDLFIANSLKGLITIDISVPESPIEKNRIQTAGRPYEMYLHNDEAILLLNSRSDWTSSHIDFISSPGTATEVAESIDIEGYIIDSRLVGDILYIVTNDYDYSGGASSWYESQTTVVTAIDTTTRVTTETLYVQGYSNAIHVGSNDLFVASSASDDYYNRKSRITRYDISSGDGTMIENGHILVQGGIADRFKLDYYQDYLRVISYDWNARTTFLYSIPWAAEPPAEMPLPQQLGIGDTLYGTRFDGDRAYIVTFQRVDPLYIIDFTDPANPVIAGELDEIPGWSEHIEVLGNKLFTIGVDDQNGWNVKVCSFDVTDPANPTLQDSIELGNGSTSWSGANWDYKRLNYLQELDLFAVPYTSYTSDNRMINAVSLIKVSNTTLSVFAELLHNGSVKRTIPVEAETLYTYNDQEITPHKISSGGSVTSSRPLVLAEYVNGVWTIDNTTAVKAVSPSGYGSTVLRTFNQNEAHLVKSTGEITVPTSGYSWISPSMQIMNNKRLYWLSNNYKNNAREIELHIFDFNDAANPRLARTITLNVDDYSNQWYYYSSLCSYGDSISLINDDTLLYISRTGFKVFNLEAPDDPQLVAEEQVEAMVNWTVQGSDLIITTGKQKQTSQLIYTVNTLDSYRISKNAVTKTYSLSNIPGAVIGKTEDGHWISYYTRPVKDSDNQDFVGFKYYLLEFSATGSKASVIAEKELPNPLDSAKIWKEQLIMFTGYNYYGYYLDDAVYSSTRSMPWYGYGDTEMLTLTLSQTAQLNFTKQESFNAEMNMGSDLVIYGENYLHVPQRDAIKTFTVLNEKITPHRDITRNVENRWISSITFTGSAYLESLGWEGIVTTTF